MKKYSLIYNADDEKFYLYDDEKCVFDTKYWGQAIWKFELLIGRE